jgi:hypothetical protein
MGSVSRNPLYSVWGIAKSAIALLAQLPSATWEAKYALYVLLNILELSGQKHHAV